MSDLMDHLEFGGPEPSDNEPSIEASAVSQAESASMPSSDQVDTLDEALATYHSDSCPAETEFQEFFTPNLVKYCDCRVKKLKAKLSALLVEAELNGLKAVQAKGQDWQEPNEGTAHELYARIKELQQGASASTESLTASGKQADNHNEEDAR